MIAVIAAYDRNRVIGNNGGMPWHIPGEQRRFRELTTGAAVIMGRRTWQEIGRPLPGRRNIVLSGDPDFIAPGCLVAHTLAQSIALAGDLDIYFSGGAKVYAQALPLADALYLTEIDAEYPGDTFFPDFSRADFELLRVEPQPGPIPYRYCTWRRISRAD